MKKSPDYKFRQTSAKLRLDQWEHFGYSFCEHCGRTTKELDAHHIIFRSEKPDHPHIHDEKNIILVCRKCHNRFHDQKGTRNELVIKRSLNDLFGDEVLNK